MAKQTILMDNKIGGTMPWLRILCETVTVLAIPVLVISCTKQKKTFSFAHELSTFRTLMSDQLPYDYENFVQMKVGRALEKDIQNSWSLHNDLIVIIRSNPNGGIYQGDLLYTTDISNQWCRTVYWKGLRDEVEQTNMIHDNRDFIRIHEDLGKLTNSLDIGYNTAELSDGTWWFITRKKRGAVTRYVTYSPDFTDYKGIPREYWISAEYRLLFTQIAAILDERIDTGRGKTGAD